MIKKLCEFFFLFLFLHVDSIAQTGWVQRANFPGVAREYDAGFSIGEYGFVGCGYNGTCHTDFWKYTPTTNTWAAITNYPGFAQYGCSNFTLEGKGYVCFGETCSLVKGSDLWSYDTITNTWIQLANFPGTTRYDCSVFVLGHKAYFLGGSAGGPPFLEDDWVYDAHANTWKQISNFPGGKLESILAFAIGNYGYAGCGWDGTLHHKTMWKYDTTSDSWSPIDSFPVYGPGLGANPRPWVNGSKAYVSNGCDGSIVAMATGEIYDTITKRWCDFSRLIPINRAYCAGFNIGNYGYMGTGLDSAGNSLNDFWEYAPVAKFVALDTDLCLIDSVHLIDSSTYIVSTWNWSFPGGSPSISSLQSPFVTYTSSGTYTVKLIITGCDFTDTLTRQIHVFTNNIPFTISGKQSLCSGIPDTLTASGGTTYLWSNGGTTSIIIVNPVSTTTYSVHIANACGTKDTSITVIINPIPKAEISGNTQICKGDSVTLTASGGGNYLWNTGQTTGIISVKPSSTTIFTLSVTNSYGCKADTTFMVNVVLPGSVSGPSSLCLGDSITLIASGGGTYQWNTGETTASITVKPTSNITYSVIVSSFCTDTLLKTITINYPDLFACCDTTITLTGEKVILNASGTTYYYWSPNTGGLSCDSCPNPIVSPTVTTTYTVIGTDSSGCKVERLITIDVSSCLVPTIPNVFTPNGDGRNDEFIVNAQSTSDYSIIIYDRWGKEMYKSTNPDVYWDGKNQNDNSMVSDGVYYYIIKYTCNGKSTNKDGYLQVIK